MLCNVPEQMKDNLIQLAMTKQLNKQISASLEDQVPMLPQVAEDEGWYNDDKLTLPWMKPPAYAASSQTK